MIYGYSYGRVLANHLSKRLNKEGIKVNFMATVDAANGYANEKEAMIQAALTL